MVKCSYRYRFYILLFLLSVVMSMPVHNVSAQQPDTESFSSLKEKIQAEQFRLIDKYQELAVRLSNEADSSIKQLELYSNEELKVLYAKRLWIFLKSTDRYYTPEYLRSGRYTDALRFFSDIQRWHQRDSSVAWLSENRQSVIKALQLIPSDSSLHLFLHNELLNRPDEVLRNTDGFTDRPFARSLLEKIARDDPDAIKRYLGTENNVNQLLAVSTDSVVREIYHIYQTLGMKSAAFVLLNDIITKKMTIAQADSLQSYPRNFNDYLIKLIKQKDFLGKRSVQKMLMNYNIDAARNLNNISLLQKRQVTVNDLSRFSREQLVLLLIFGYREFTPSVYNNILQIASSKGGPFISENLIHNINPQLLSRFIEFNDQTKNLNTFLSLVEKNMQPELLNLLLNPYDDLNSFTEITNSPKPSFIPSLQKIDIPKSEPPITDSPMGKTSQKDSIFNTENQITNTVYEQVSAKQETKEKLANDPEQLEIFTRRDEVNLNKPASFLPKLNHLSPVTSSEQTINMPAVAIHFTMEEREKLKKLRSPLQSLQQLSEWISIPSAKEILMALIKTNPDDVLKRADVYFSKQYSLEVVEQAAIASPVSARRYLFNKYHPVTILLLRSENPTIKQLIALHHIMGQESRALCLLNDVCNGKMKPTEAIHIAGQPNVFYQCILLKSLEKVSIGRYSLEREINPYCLKILREINNRIAQKASNPFEGIERMSAGELLGLMVNGRDEVYAKNLQGLISRFSLKLEDKTADYFIQNISKENIRKFIGLCGSNGYLPQLTNQFQETEIEKLLQYFISGLDTASLQQTSLVAECLLNTDDPICNKYLHFFLKEEFEHSLTERKNKGISLYGLLINLMADRAAGDRMWFQKIAEQFQTAAVSDLSVAELMGPGKVCTEQVYFYNDEDGIASYENFIKTFKNRPEWAIEDRYNYVRVYSTNGNRIDIFANKPVFEQNGIAAIREHLQSSGIEPAIIVHRGYSFYTHLTIAELNKNCKLVFLGSCGGFHQIATAISNAPSAQFITTKQIGTLHINDPILLALNERIRSNQNLEWVSFWSDLDKQLHTNPLFLDYIPPHRNIESLLSKAFYRLLDS